MSIYRIEFFNYQYLILKLMKTSFVFLADGFEEIEALATVDVMRRAGMPVITVSINATLQVTGAHGVVVMADALVDDCDMANAEWLICPGGMPGATHLAACEPLCRALVEQNRCGGHLAAICASPAIVLAPLGIINNRDAVCYPGMAVEGYGVNWCEPKMVVVDGNVVTGRGPAAAYEFGLTIVAQSMGTQVANEVATGMLID